MADCDGQRPIDNSRQGPFKYDIRVTGDLYVDESDNGATTKVSVKIRGNEDGDVIVEQDDSKRVDSRASKSEAINEGRKPPFSHNKGSDGRLQLHIHALPLRKVASAQRISLTGGGKGDREDCTSPLLSTPSRLRASNSYINVSPSRSNTRMSELRRGSALSSAPSFAEVGRAFEDSDAQSIARSEYQGMPLSPRLVGGGSRFRPRSSTCTSVEDKSTMTTFRGLPIELKASSPSRASALRTPEIMSTFSDAGRNEQLSSPVLRGGGATDITTYRSAINSPHQSRSRPPTSERVNYREKAEKLLTQYFPPDVLKNYLNELRRQYRFMGPGGIPSSDISQILERTTADRNTKRKLQASLEELVRAPPSDDTDNEQDSSTEQKSQPQYLSIRNTEAGDVLDRTSISPAPKSERDVQTTPAPSNILVGGGQSIDDLNGEEVAVHSNTPYSQLNADALSATASVKPAKSVKDDASCKQSTIRTSSTPRSVYNGTIKSASDRQSVARSVVSQAVDNATSNTRSESRSAAAAAAPTVSSRGRSVPRTVSDVVSVVSESNKVSDTNGRGASNEPSHTNSSSEQTQYEGLNSGGPKKVPQDYWDNIEKFRMRPPDMSQAFTILKSQPIIMRKMSETDFNFKSPFTERKASASPLGRESQFNWSANESPDSHSHKQRASTFDEKHPTEAKVAKAVSELEEVLRRTEADTRAKIEEDLQSMSTHHTGSYSCCTRSTGNSARSRTDPNSNSTSKTPSSTKVPANLAGGGASAAASSRSASVSTRVSDLSSKHPSLASGAMRNYADSNGTVRTDASPKEDVENSDTYSRQNVKDLSGGGSKEDEVNSVREDSERKSDNRDQKANAANSDYEDGDAKEDDEEYAQEVKVQPSAADTASANPQPENNASTVSLPMHPDNLPPELASVIRRTGGLDDTKLRRSETPSEYSSNRRCVSTTPDPAIEESLKKSAAPSEAGSKKSFASRVPSNSNPNRSLTELDVVMGRTGGYSNSRPTESQYSTPSNNSILRGGSGSPTPISPVSNGSDNELSSVMRRTRGFVPSRSDSEHSTISSKGSHNGAASESPKRLEPRPGISTVASGRHFKSSYQPSVKDDSQSVTSKTSRPSQHSSISSAAPRPPSAYQGTGVSSYRPSPLRNSPYRPSISGRSAAGDSATGPPSPIRHVSPRSPPPPAALSPEPTPRAEGYNPAPSQGQPERQDEARSPSPVIPRAPTPIFGRFPSPPPYIKNRGKNNNTDAEAQDGPTGAPPNAPPQQPAPSTRPHSRSVYQDPSVSISRTSNRDVEPPVVERLDLETGSIASRRSRNNRGSSEFGSASTLLSENVNSEFRVPKVVEEDIDSLASYSSSQHREASPNLVGGGRVPPKPQEPSTLRGGGALDLSFLKDSTSKDRANSRFSQASSPYSQKTSTCNNASCGVCGMAVHSDDAVVRPHVMHASCLRCEICDCLLTSSTFRAIEGHVYCEEHYTKYFPRSKVDLNKSRLGIATAAAAARFGLSDEKYKEMNRAIMESFTSVDDFLQHMRDQRAMIDKYDAGSAQPNNPELVQKAGDVDIDRQTHYEREQVTSPSGTPWITERVVDKKTKTKVLEKRYPASESPVARSANASSYNPVDISSAEEPTLIGGGAVRSRRLESGPPRVSSSASRPESSLLNDSRLVNGWDHPLCPVCSRIVYVADRVVHDGYGYHKSCMRCRQCSQVVQASSAMRIKGAIYCKKHGGDLLRRRSILMRKKSTMSRRSRHRKRETVTSDYFSGSSAGSSSPLSSPPPLPAQRPSKPLPVPNADNKTGGQPGRQISTALRTFLEAATEQIENKSYIPLPIDSATVKTNPPSSAPAKDTPKYGPRPMTKPEASRQSYPPSSAPQSPKDTYPLSNSIFAGSRESLYDPNVVNALRQEAQRQINTSQTSLAQSGGGARGSNRFSPVGQRLLTPRGPSIADNLQKFGGSNDGRVSVSSHFDPFMDASTEHIGSSNHTSPQSHQPPAFTNRRLDDLERRFRNANFRPPWAVKPQSAFE